MKTIREWFKTLPEPYRKRALLNINHSTANMERGSLSDAIWSGFIWRETLEGGTFWADYVLELAREKNNSET